MQDQFDAKYAFQNARILKSCSYKKDIDRRYSLVLNLADLFAYNKLLLDGILRSPARALQSVQEAIVRAQQALYEEAASRANLVVQELVQARP